jgi:acyl-CoA thioester hydrolase
MAGMSEAMKEEGLFQFEHRVPVRFSDIDAGGHAHHSKVLVYMEEARARYWEEVAGRRGVEEIDFILAEARVRYRSRVLYPDLLRVLVRVGSIGRRHFEMLYEVRSDGGEVLAEGVTTMVMFDYVRERSMSVSDELRKRIEAFEGGALPRGRSRG